MNTFDAIVIYLMTIYFAATAELPYYTNRDSYIAQVEAMPRDHGPRFKLWELSGWMNITTCLIYDESDEVVLKHRSSAWISRTGWDSIPPGAKPVDGHFYIITTDTC